MGATVMRKDKLVILRLIMHINFEHDSSFILQK
jgi:hypothetical protein